MEPIKKGTSNTLFLWLRSAHTNWTKPKTVVTNQQAPRAPLPLPAGRQTLLLSKLHPWRPTRGFCCFLWPRSSWVWTGDSGLLRDLASRGNSLSCNFRHVLIAWPYLSQAVEMLRRKKQSRAEIMPTPKEEFGDPVRSEATPQGYQRTSPQPEKASQQSTCSRTSHHFGWQGQLWEQQGWCCMTQFGHMK